MGLAVTSWTFSVRIYTCFSNARNVLVKMIAQKIENLDGVCWRQDGRRVCRKDALDCDCSSPSLPDVKAVDSPCSVTNWDGDC